MSDILQHFSEVRDETVRRCAPLTPEDYIVQVATFASPPKWHLGHTTWFFETFILTAFDPNYTVFNDQYGFLFNSYYNTVGRRIDRSSRGALTRPSVDEILDYRHHVDEAIKALLNNSPSQDIIDRVTLGLHHEQQHQELLLTDIKYVLWHNPLLPAYHETWSEPMLSHKHSQAARLAEGIYEIGFDGDGFSFDAERKRHKHFIHPCTIDQDLVTNGQYLAFIEDGGYDDVNLWHDEGWAWRQQHGIEAPLYWMKKEDGQWEHFTLSGCRDLEENAPVKHVSFYEAWAFALWAGKRLCTEFEWEAAADQLNWGHRWEWTNSAFLPYPGFAKAKGAIGEYNGKFMINQMILRGGSCVTPAGHSRTSYRNFFHPDTRWQFSGVRLAQNA